MSYFSDIEYKKKEAPEALWFEKLYFQRWFGSTPAPILDIGCATGNFIALDPERIEGIDIDDDRLAIASSRGFKVSKLNAQNELGSLPENQYHGIYAKHVIEHIPDPLSFMKGVHRILAPGGKAVISTPNCPYMLTRYFYDDYTHIHPFTRSSLRMLSYDAGFTKLKLSEDFLCFPGLGKLMRVFGISPHTVRSIQAFFGIRGLSLILEIEK